MKPDPSISRLTFRDRQQIRSRGVSLKEVSRQASLFQTPPSPPQILCPCSLGNGIESFSRSQQNRLARLALCAQQEDRFSKFVPASGAASRLFPPGGTLDPRLTGLLGRDVLHLVRRPKALIPFHRLRKGSRTAFEEHLWEAVRAGIGKAHFTVPGEFLEEFRCLGKACVEQLHRRYGVRLRLSFSVQDPSTETLAWEEGSGWARRAEGELLFRPGGHGALLKNLEATRGDIVFIKNIDNVPRFSFQAEGNRWRKVLAGRLIEVQMEAGGWINALSQKRSLILSLEGAEKFILKNLGMKRSGPSLAARTAHALEILDRPWRVCGMVPNTGEPGGGPFWVKGKEGPSRQILEGSQLTKSQKKFIDRSTHFNPVDMVVGLKDGNGRSYELSRFADPAQAIISVKHFEGRAIRTLEHPGLWNGAMAHWNTIFVEVPATVFHPVKTITDLLRPGHAGPV